MIPAAIKNLFQRRTQGRVCSVGPVTVSGVLEEALNGLLPGEALEMTGRDSGRQYAVVLREDLEHVIGLAGMRLRK